MNLTYVYSQAQEIVRQAKKTKTVRKAGGVIDV